MTYMKLESARQHRYIPISIIFQYVTSNVACALVLGVGVPCFCILYLMACQYLLNSKLKDVLITTSHKIIYPNSKLFTSYLIRACLQIENGQILTLKIVGLRI